MIMNGSSNYRRLRGDMTEVFKTAHNYYDSRAVVNLNFQSFSTTRGKKLKLQKINCQYNIRKYLFGSELLISGIVYHCRLRCGGWLS